MNDLQSVITFTNKFDCHRNVLHGLVSVLSDIYYVIYYTTFYVINVQ